eukprot:gene20706-biopygen17092
MFRKVGFELHKGHCNEHELDGESSNNGEPTYAKESLGTKPSEMKLLGVKWDKGKDTLSITFLDNSTFCLYWIQGAGKYKQFVANRVAKINQWQITWRHVPTSVNQADTGCRGETKLQEKELWIKGPTWLSTPEQWQPMITCEPSSESESERHLMKQVMQTAFVRGSDEIDCVIEKKSFWQSLRILAWMKRFIKNRKKAKAKRLTSPLTTDKTEQQKRFLTKRVQSDAKANHQFKYERTKLNLQKDANGIYRCMGRIQGVYRVYLLFEHIISQKQVEWAHYQTLHGGVSMTMSKVSDSYWIPKLRACSHEPGAKVDPGI